MRWNRVEADPAPTGHGSTPGTMTTLREALRGRRFVAAPHILLGTAVLAAGTSYVGVTHGLRPWLLVTFGVPAALIAGFAFVVFVRAALAGHNLSDAVSNHVVPAVNVVCRARNRPIGVWFMAVPVWTLIVVGFTVFWPHVDWWTLWGEPSGSTAGPGDGGEQFVFVLCALLAPIGILVMPLLLTLFVAMPFPLSLVLARVAWRTPGSLRVRLLGVIYATRWLFGLGYVALGLALTFPGAGSALGAGGGAGHALLVLLAPLLAWGGGTAGVIGWVARVWLLGLAAAWIAGQRIPRTM